MSALPAGLLCLAISYAGMPIAGSGQEQRSDSRPALVASSRVDGGLLLPLLGTPASHTRRPNILLITTDDQRWDELRYMPRTRRLIGSHGTVLHGLSPHPLCCPARASILTGQLAHNHGVRSNKGPDGGYQALPKRRTLAVWLARAGYQTAFLGKHLNGYEGQGGRPDPGWKSWHALAGGVYDYGSFTVNHDGVARRHDTYQTDYFSRLAARQIHRLADRARPFFLWQSYLAPHKRMDDSAWAPPAVARRHAGLFPDAPLASLASPAFNEADVSDKPRWVRRLPLLVRSDVSELTRLYRQRIRSLQAVDQGVARAIDALRSERELRNTLVIFTSDNGYLLGEHRYAYKDVAFDPAMRVPLLMRGPAVPVGRRTGSIGTSADVAATIVRAARAEPSVELDGRDLRPLTRGEIEPLDTVLIQAGARRAKGEPTWFWRGVRTHRYTFVRYPGSGEVELYDRRHDPAHLVNVAGDPRYSMVLSEMSERLAELKSCAGAECTKRFGPVTPPGD